MSDVTYEQLEKMFDQVCGTVGIYPSAIVMTEKLARQIMGDHEFDQAVAEGCVTFWKEGEQDATL